MLLIGAELLRIGKNLYVTKSEPGANHLGTTCSKNIKTSERRQIRRFSIIITFCKTKRVYNKPPEKAVFCYTKIIIKALTSIIQDKTIIKISKQTLSFTFLAATVKNKEYPSPKYKRFLSWFLY